MTDEPLDTDATGERYINAADDKEDRCCPPR